MLVLWGKMVFRWIGYRVVLLYRCLKKPQPLLLRTSTGTRAALW